MTQIQFTNAARQDLKDIFRYTVRTWGRPQAQKYSEQLKQHVTKIAQDMVFSRPVQNGRPNVQQSMVGRHILIFEQAGGHVLIIRVLHDAMVIPNHIISMT
jgi:toxin ParE1/3/4